MKQDARDAVDAAAIITMSTGTLRSALTMLADEVEPESIAMTRVMSQVLDQIDEATMTLAMSAATPEMFADRT